MMTYRMTGLAAGLISGIILASHTPLQLPLLLAGLFFILGLGATIGGIIAERHWHLWPRTILFAAACLLALPIGYHRTHQVMHPQGTETLRKHLTHFENGDMLELQGRITTEPEWRREGQVDLEVRVQALRSPDGKIWQPVSQGIVRIRAFAYPSNRPETFDHLNELAAPSAYGYQVSLTAPYRPIHPPLNPGAFDYQQFLHQSGIETSLRCHAARIEILSRDKGFLLTELALATKTRFLETFKRTIRAPASRIAAAATLGTRRAVEHIPYRGKDITEMFRHAGVGHVLAVSGLHVSVIAVLLFALFRLTGAKPRIFVPPLIFILILFAILTGARPSSVRAVIMNSVILFMIAYFRCGFRTATTIGLSLSAFFILLHNPLIAFSPSFLLSYGAVLSLISLAPPFERFLYAQRGFSALFFLLWFCLAIAMAGWHFHLLVQPLVLLSLGALLWLGILLGGRCNLRFPRMWNTGFARLPGWLRMFLAAQLAIQVGMMLPLSAWFFGRFPVAGILVNLFAIPAVGILVQLGMLVGLVGLIPWIGGLLAYPFGAATAVVGELFLLIAHTGSSLFPFPATPQPTLPQLAGYYGLIGVLLLLERNRHLLLDGIYRLYARKPPNSRLLATLLLIVPLLLVLLPALWPRPSLPTAERVQVLAVRRYPILTITGDRTADIINAGGRYDGERLLFDLLRAEGATRVRNTILPAPDPRAGIEGAAALAAIIPLQNIRMPQLPQQGESFLEMLGDAYVIQKAEEGIRWAQNYQTSFEQLVRQIHQHPGMELHAFPAPPALLAEWTNIRLRSLPLSGERPRRFQTSAITPLLEATIHGRTWIIITDTLPEALPVPLQDIERADVLVVPDLGSRSAYFRWLRDATRLLNPRILIIGGDQPLDWPARQAQWLAEQQQQGLHVFQTGADGAVVVDLLPSGKTRFQTHLTSKKGITLPR